MNSVSRFFWYCAGVHQDTLAKYPEEHNKYVSIGATIFFTGLFAALSGGYALYFVFSGNDLSVVYAIIFGLIWGLAIFNLDRYIVLSIDKTKGSGKQFLQAFPRILLAILVGVVISRPLELKIFDKEIREHLRGSYLSQQRAKIDTLNQTFENKYATEYGQLNGLKKQADSLDSSIKSDKQKLNFEIFGNKTTETSGVMGYGPYAKMKEAQLKKQEIYLDTLRTRIQQKEVVLLERKSFEGILDQKLLSNKSLDSAVNIAGFADRNAALGNLKFKADGSVDQATENAVLFIALLFIFFECLPVFVKLMSGRDSYDQALLSQREIHNYESHTSIAVEKSAIDNLEGFRTDVSIKKRMDKLNNDYHEEKEV
ncbi:MULTISPECIES: DUF4407 domain-containing protein [Sphingobacterium]|uniref:DUF4407 domain-containing protein n=1 Tax=Sphingobacterium TaxID=28453 RepID=UPI00191A9175|nr:MULTISPECIES: DUF4407 domain-containing protein [Sphingobacterium]QQT27714.1 DUF4407 domain-containing protein [Sphingobacterium spiritivorum]